MQSLNVIQNKKRAPLSHKQSDMPRSPKAKKETGITKAKAKAKTNVKVTAKTKVTEKAKAKTKPKPKAKVSHAKQVNKAVIEYFPIDSWLAMPPSECFKAVMKHTMHAWKAGVLASHGRVLDVSDRRQAVGMGLGKARAVCDSPRRLTAAQATAMRRDPTHNPLTGHTIAPLGFTAQVLHALAVSKTTSPSRKPSPSRRVKAKA